MWRELVTEVRDAAVDAWVIAATDGAALTHSRWVGRRHAYEVVFETMTEVDEAGRQRRIDVYPAGDPAAWDRYCEVAQAQLTA